MNYESAFVSKLEQIIISSGGSVPPMTGPTNFQARSLELLDAINVAAGKTNTPAFSVYKSASQSFNDLTLTLVSWDAEVRDTDNAFTNNTFTVPAGKGGLYYFQAKLTFGSNILRALIILYKNGGEAARLYDEYIDLDLLTASAAAMLDLVPGDQVALYLLLDTADGGAASTLVLAPAQSFSQFSGFRLIA